ncbi:hypothetical protein FRC01_003043 [Tulasnella sp. 417]|nr:hypothetical protein FRC01_003043 [Tulasnella sp. 417]
MASSQQGPGPEAGLQGLNSTFTPIVRPKGLVMLDTARGAAAPSVTEVPIKPKPNPKSKQDEESPVEE